MSNCKNCSLPIELKQGRRPREFCDNNQKCRNEYFRKNKKEKEFKTIPMNEWNEIEKKLAADKSGFNGIVPAVEATGKKVPYDKSNFTINTFKPPKLAGETALDYRIRLEELEKQK